MKKTILITIISFIFGAVLTFLVISSKANNLIYSFKNKNLGNQSDKLEIELTKRLEQQLNDSNLASSFTNALLENYLITEQKRAKYAQANSIFVLDFGYYLDEFGLPKAGLINKELANIAIELYSKQNKPVFVSAIIAKEIGNKIAKEDLIIIYPKVIKTANNANSIAINSNEFIAQVLSTGNDSTNLGNVALISFYDKAVQAMKILKKNKVNSFIPTDIQLPKQYDQKNAVSYLQDKKSYFNYLIKTNLVL